MLQHLTIHITPGALIRVHSLMSLLGFREVLPDDEFEHGYAVRWFKRSGSPLVHFVATDHDDSDRLSLGHFCMVISSTAYGALTKSEYCSRESGSGRAWLEYDAIRIEIRTCPAGSN